MRLLILGPDPGSVRERIEIGNFLMGINEYETPEFCLKKTMTEDGKG